MKKHWFKLFLVGAFLALPAYAFKPTAEFGHVGIDRDALKTITRDSSDGSQTFRFSEKAILEIRDSTAGVDEIISARGELSVPKAHCDDELLPECSQRIIDIRNDVINFLKASPPDGENARRKVGRALHTLQDFYSHSNWVEIGNSGANLDLGRRAVPKLAEDDQTCETGFSNLGAGTLTDFGLTDLTTGYFSIVFAAPEGKCNHGLLLDPGIHKDSPGRVGHSAARAAAVLGTRDLINQVLDAPGISGNDEAIRAFMGVKGSLGFVVDDTGSMGPVIAGVKNQVNRIVDLVADDPDKEPDKYILVRFGDPDVGPVFVTDQASSLRRRVNSLFADGGDDCPELSMSGMLNAIDASSSGSSLYLFTDATAKDSSLGSNVVAAARAKNITIHAYLFGSCSPIDPAYYTMTSETGGQLLLLNRTVAETEKLFDLINPSLTGDLQPITISKGNITGTREMSVAIDSSVTNAVFSVGMDVKGQIQLFDPAGVEVLTGVTDISSGKTFTVESPLPGLWKLRIAGNSAYSLSVSGNSKIEFNRFAFVELRGRSGHEGLFPIRGEPLASSIHTAMANVFGDLNSVIFELRSEDGELIKEINLVKGGHEDAANDDFVGEFTLPSDRFRVFLHATALDGSEVVRAFPPVFTGQSVRVSPVGDGATRLLAGRVNNQRFEITNLGLRDTFSVSATDNQGFLAGIRPNSLTLEQNESRIVDVSVDVPVGTPNNTVVTITLVAEGFSTANNVVTSFVVQENSIAGDLDFDGDVDRDDINILILAKGQLASSNTDPRDIDGDGRISILDARKAIRLCTNRRCERE